MKPSFLLAGESRSPLLPLAAVLFAVAIFIVDTFTPLGIAVAVLYVVVVLVAGRFFQRRGVLFVGFACLALTVLSYVLQHGGDPYGPAFVRCLVSMAAIAITTFLALRIQSAGAILREQASLLDITHDAVFVRDMNDVVTFWNRGAEELYGWPSEKALGQISHELLHTVFPKPRQEIRADLLHNDRWEGELTHTKRDGTEVVVASRWSIQRNRSGPVAILETNNDVTERKRAENALRKSEAYLAEAQRLSQTGSWAWDVASRCNLHWSAETYRIFGFDPDADENSFVAARDRIHPDDQPPFDRAMETASKEGKDFEVDFRLLLPDGEIKHIHTVGHPVRDATGRVVELVGTNVDITAAKRAEEELNQALAELSHVTRVTTLGELTASIAHEVNQPLAAVITNADSSLRWLGRETPNMDEARGALERIIRDANRASEVIRRIRDLATCSEPEREQIDINEAIRDTVLLMQRELMRQRVALKLDLDLQLPKVLADRVQLQQVIINLVMNGIEAMANVDDRRHELRIDSRLHEGERVLVAFQDRGIGVDPENEDRLFTAFFTTKPGGMGMGLSICRSIIEAHDGRLWASGNDGAQGATFQFTLPIYRESQS
jgi:PAS domain S-box-containing protein